MIRIRRLALGTLLTVGVIVAAALLSAWPAWRATSEGAAVMKLSLSHGGARECRQLSDEELAELPPNMRRREVCDRRRQPVYLELEIDGRRAFAASLPPTGLSGDGPSRLYQRFELAAGSHQIALRLRDDGGEGFTYSARRELTLAPGQSLAIDFEPRAGGFTFN